jgi:uncharacterized protein YndB with AHSA1/START domain
MRVLFKWLGIALIAAHATSVHADRTLVNEADIDATPAEVWDAWTTEDGFTSWAVAKAKIDLRVGGEMITSYVADSTLDDDSTIINRILSFEPERMLSIQNVRAPKAFKNAELFQEAWTVLYLEPLSNDRTHVRIVGMGYGDGPEWDDIYNKFKVGNEYTLQQLRERFSSSTESKAAASGSHEPKIDAHNIVADDQVSAVDAAKVMALLGQLVGGNWIHDGHAPDGGVFLVRNVLEHGPDGVSIVGKGWLSGEQGMTPHGSTQIYRDPGTGAVRFFNIDENSSVSQGDIVLVDNDTVQWNWNLHAQTGRQAQFRVLMKFSDGNHYQFMLSMQGDDGQWNQMVDAGFERVSEMPEKFKVFRSSR